MLKIKTSFAMINPALFLARTVEGSSYTPFQVLLWCSLGGILLWKILSRCGVWRIFFKKDFFKENDLTDSVKSFFGQLSSAETSFFWEIPLADKNAKFETCNEILVWDSPWYLKELSLWVVGYFEDYEADERLICWDAQKDEICFAEESFDVNQWARTGKWEAEYVGQNLETFIESLTLRT